MLNLYISNASYDYDIQAITRDFYPGVSLKISYSKDEGVVYDIQMLLEGKDLTITLWELEESYEVMEDSEQSYKNAVKRYYYQALQKFTGKTLPWGNLTGIRPTKIASNLLEAGYTEEKIIEYFVNQHQADVHKASLCAEIASREKRILQNLQKDRGYSLYVGIPFCPTKCHYCSFTSFPIEKYASYVEAFLQTLEREMEETAQLMKGYVLETVYVGGGTPTALSCESLCKVLTDLRRIFDFQSVSEFTVEAGRPDSITEEKLRLLKEMGVTRISINPQTMNDETLLRIGRHHTAAAICEKYEMARRLGFDNINMDIILGLPGENLEDLERTLQEILRLHPDSLTVHSLSIKRAAKMGIEGRNPSDASMDMQQAMDLAYQAAVTMGMNPYYLYRQKNMSGSLENVGYAKDDKYGIYNILIMEEIETIMALGPGSVSKAVLPGNQIRRCDNPKDIKLYIERAEEMDPKKKVLLSDTKECKIVREDL